MSQQEFLEGLPLHAGRIEARPYQVDTARRALAGRGALVVMATALGKTYIALLAYAALLKADPKARCLFLAPTKPLVAQQAERLRECVRIAGRVEVVTGEQPPEDRELAYLQAQVVAATPQAVANDVRHGRADLSRYSLIVFDEAHRAVGDYAYVPLGQAAQQTKARLLGLTASPSSQRDKVEEVCRNLGVEDVIYKSEKDDDVAEYSNPVEFEPVFVTLPDEMNSLRDLLAGLYRESAQRLKPWGLEAEKPNKRLLLELQKRLVRDLPRTGRALTEVTRAMNLAHALDLLESEGVGPLADYLARLGTREKKSRAVLELLRDPRIARLHQECEQLLAAGFEHPKMGSLRTLVQDAAAAGQSAIVFVHYRSSAERVCTALNQLPGVKASILVGRAGETGMRQADQVETVRQFADKEFNVLVATQVGEEGLSIHSVDLVVFYEAVPSEIRLIQRRGRTGRVRAGRAVVLVAKGTKDEAFLWSSKSKERRLRGVLESVGGSLAPGQSKVSEFS